MLRGKLPELYAHCLGASATPRITVTTHPGPAGERIWYLGGQIAESGVERSGPEQIAAGRRELSRLLPWLDLAGIGWAGFRVERAEPRLAGGRRPDRPFLETQDRVSVVWPTKLAFAPALAAGCTVVCKPANATPLSAYAFAELAERAGVPAGVINLVTGRTPEIGKELTSNPIVRKLTFTGSTPVGKQLMAECAQTVKRTSMELGGNAPFIVFDDADLDAALAGVMASKYRNSGQTCVCANRILIQEGVYDVFAEMLAKAVKGLKVGDGADEGVTIGPLINEGAANDVMGFVDDAVDKGASVIAGGRRSEMGACFIEPTILTNVSDDMRVFREEIFGPIAPLFKFKTEEEAIAMANDTEFGLACYFYSRDIGRVWRVGEGLEYGIVGINEGIISNEMAPFGGVKESGQGREGSKYGMDDYLEMKYMCMGGIDQ